MGDKGNQQTPFQINFNISSAPLDINGTTLIPMNETTKSCAGMLNICTALFPVLNFVGQLVP